MLFAVLTGTLFFISIAPRAIAGPDQTTYRVRVASSFGTLFTDCFRFDTPNTGDLSIDRLFQVLTYRHGQLDLVQSGVSEFRSARDHVLRGSHRPIELLNGGSGQRVRRHLRLYWTPRC
jgi:hypothetical protein